MTRCIMQFKFMYLQTTLDFMNKQGWGFKDTEIIYDHKKGEGIMTGMSILF